MGYTWVKEAVTGLLFATLLLWAVAAFGQGSGTCTLTGTVYDSSGAVVSGARVQLSQKATSASRETVANGSGFFFLHRYAGGNL